MLTADRYVLALGVEAPIVARTPGVRMPIYPAKGYSSTFPFKAGGRRRPSPASTSSGWSAGRGWATACG